MNSIYAYADYREYLKDFIAEKRLKNPRYSTRCAAMRCGVGSGTFTRILNGTRLIGPSLLPKFVAFLALRRYEGEYFEALVRFSHLKDQGEKRRCFEEILRLRSVRKRQVSEQDFQFFEQWYHVAVHELLRVIDERGDGEALGAALTPPVSGPKVRKALDLLEKLGYVKRDDTGRLLPSEPFVTTGDIWKGQAVHAFQVAMSALGTESLDRFDRDSRDISTLSMALSGDAFSKVREVIKRAREEIASIERYDTNPTRVYQINFQVFPLSAGTTSQEGQS